MIEEKIKQKALEYFEEVCNLRRHFHQHPELSFQEINTSKFIAEYLSQKNIAHQDNIVKTGIIATIKGKNPDKRNILLRADIDALPIKEENDVPYCSKNNGVMHACGHDAHTASMIGVLLILNDLKAEFEGTVNVVFQPGEEKLPGGASLMLKEKAFKAIKAECVVGQHVYPELPTGKVGFRSGMYMASCDEIQVTITGKGGHAALPHKYNNPIIVAAKLLERLNALFMGENNICPATIPTILAFGDIHGSGATNVIPEQVFLQGTFRTLDENWRTEAHKVLLSEAGKIAKKTNTQIDFLIDKGYPTLVNDEAVTEKAKNAAIKYLGEENVVDLGLRMTSEDFAYYSQQMPACFYRFGVADKTKPQSGLHTSTFDIDEQALKTGMGLMAFLAVNL